MASNENLLASEFTVRPISQTASTQQKITNITQGLLYSILIVIAFLVVVLLIIITVNTLKVSRSVLPISTKSSSDSGQCINRKGINFDSSSVAYLQHKLMNNKLLIRDSTRKWDKAYVLINGRTLVNSNYTPVSVVIKDGKIWRLSYTDSINPTEYASISTSIEIVDLDRKFVTPGLFDIHSHLGVFSFPYYGSTDDGNELSDPLLPQVNALDAFAPKDPMIEVLMRYGITSSLVLPGSTNVMGGQGMFIKLIPNTHSVDQMLISGAPRALKFACGENPKNFYGDKGSPQSRMGTAWLLRKRFSEARELMRQQDRWDCENQDASPDGPISDRPYDLGLEPLVTLLRGKDQIYLNMHCYQVHDFEMMVRVSQEFNFKIAAFHHASEAHLATALFKDNNITACLFPDQWGFKLEANDASLQAPNILHSKGVKFAIKTDHTALDGKLLMFNAAKARYYGLDEQATLDSVTRVPAEVVGMSHRIGVLEPGRDADVVVWDRHPLNMGSNPSMVFIDGILRMDRNLTTHDVRNPMRSIPVPRVNNLNSSSFDSRIQSNKYALKNVKIVTMDDSDRIIENGNVIVSNGVISCVGTDSQCPIDSDSLTVELKDGILIPGMIESGTYLGLTEIDSEEVTTGGQITGQAAPQVLAKNGIVTGNRPVKAAWKAGVTTSVTMNLGNIVLNGQCVAFLTTGDLIDDCVIRESVALQVSVGHYSKESTGSMSGSIAGQVQEIKEFLEQAQADLMHAANSSIGAKVLNREIAMLAVVNKADYISQLITLREKYGFVLIIVGGAEAHLVSHRISKAENINSTFIVLTLHSDLYAPKQSWDMWRTDDFYGLNLLIEKGVPKENIIIANGYSPYGIRNIRFVAGWIHEQSQVNVKEQKYKVSWHDALAMITRNPGRAFNLGDGYGRIKQGTEANFVLLNSREFDDNPLTFDNYIKGVFAKTTIDIAPVPL